MAKNQSLFRTILGGEPGDQVPGRMFPAVGAETEDLPDDETQNRTTFIHIKQAGSSGTKLFSGYPSEEYLQSLRGRPRADVFDQMRRSDPQIKMCLSAVKNPIRAAVWEIEPADDSDESKQDAEFIEFLLFKDMNRPWKKFLSEALTLVEFGHSVFEVIDKIVLNHPKWGSYVGIKKLAFRSQRTLERWNVHEKDGGLESVTQYAYGDANKVADIPAEFLLVFNVDQEGDNYEGISLIRPCYGNWKRKDVYQKLNAIGIEKFAIPTPLVDLPPGAEGTKEFPNLITALENYVSHSSAYLLKPSGWTIDLKTNTYDPQKVEVSIDNEDKRMVKAFLANFLELGMSGTGAYALSNDLSDFFLSGIDHIAGEIEHPMNDILIPRLIKMNRGERPQGYPTLKHSGVSDKAGKELADIMKVLADGKIIIPDDQLEDNARERFNLPKRSMEGQRQVQPQSFNPGMGLAERIRLAEQRRKSSGG